jgi:uncharacterized protein
MVILLSPAKKMQDKPVRSGIKNTLPDHLPTTEKLVKKLAGFSVAHLQELMDINFRIAQQNKKRFSNWSLPFTRDNANIAIHSFTGDVYVGLDAQKFSSRELDFAQAHLRILSGLYGILRPMDLIQPYRLEMGTKLTLGRHKDLYSLWKKDVNRSLAELLAKQKESCLINLASNEYFGVVDSELLSSRIITISFKEWSNNQWNIFFVNLKRARGMMARFIIENRITNPSDIQGFDSGNYHFNHDLSSGDKWVFTR